MSESETLRQELSREEEIRLNLEAELDLQRRRLDAILEVGQRLGEINNLDDLDVAYDVVADGVAENTLGEIVIHRYDESCQELVLVASHGRQYPPHVRMSLGQGANGWVARNREILVIDDIDTPPQGIDPQPSDPNTRSLLISPIQFETRYYGNLSITNIRTHAFAEADVKLIEGLVHQLAITIYRLETSAAQQLAERRANSAEVMGTVGQSTFELAHRLGNELGLVRTYNNEIRDELKALDVDSSSVFEVLDSVDSDVGRVLTLSKELKVQFAYLREDEDKTHDKIPFPVATFLEEATRSYPAQPSNISVSVDVADDIAQVLAAPDQVADILRNLYSNAIEVMPEGGAITFRARNTGKFVEIQVEDTGPGIPLKRQSRIFDLFYSTKGGFGFGLWSAKRNALVNGGDLRVVSVPGQGTVFTLSLPNAAADPTVSTSAISSLSPRPSFRVQVDDDTPITDFYQSQFKQEVDRLKLHQQRITRALGETAHELRTPVSTAALCVSNLLQLETWGELSENQRGALLIAQGELETAGFLIENLLARSRIETGKINVSRSQTDIGTLISKLADLLQRKANKHEVTIYVQVPPDFVAWVDGRLIELALRNLIENGIKFNKLEGTVKVKGDRLTDGIQIQVEDTGIGIPGDMIEHILEWEGRVNKEEEGSGYGLTIATDHIVERHGGRIDISSSLNQGTTVSIFLPNRDNRDLEEDV